MLLLLYITQNKKASYIAGVRNVKAMDFDSIGNIYVVVGGLEPRGDRG